MSTALKKITTRAKQIRKAHPSMSWIAAVKKASVEYNGGSKKKKVSGHARAKKVAVRHKKRPATVSGLGGYTTANLKAHLKKSYQEKLAWALLDRKTAGTSKAKKTAAKKVSQYSKELNAFK